MTELFPEMRVLTRVYDCGTVIFGVKILRKLIHIHDSQIYLSLDDTYVSSLCVNKKIHPLVPIEGSHSWTRGDPIFVRVSLTKRLVHYRAEICVISITGYEFHKVN